LNKVLPLCLVQPGLHHHAQLPGNMSLSTSTSHVARMTSMSHSAQRAADFL
jgi:hypothetical protein